MDPLHPDGVGAATNGRHPISLPRDQDLDELADLFLGPSASAGGGPDPSGGAREGEGPGGRIRTEGVILGHLPIYAAAWPTQYARHRAEEIGATVALVRLAAGTLSIDLFGGGPGELVADAGLAVEQVLASARLVLIRVDEPGEAELATLDLDGVTLLSGADDAAIVACYRKLKGLAASAEEAGAALPGIRLALLGATGARASAAHERIACAARAFLAAELLEPQVIERVGPTGGRCVFRGPVGLSVRDLGALLSGVRTAQDTTGAASPANVEAPPAPVGATVAEPAAPRPASESELSALVGCVRAIDVRCPVAERVELARDREGGLHLIAARLSVHPDLSGEEPLRDLARASAWARLNESLLCRADPALRAGAPVQHLVSDRREDARALLGTPVRVHLAVRPETRRRG